MIACVILSFLICCTVYAAETRAIKVTDFIKLSEFEMSVTGKYQKCAGSTKSIQNAERRCIIVSCFYLFFFLSCFLFFLFFSCSTGKQVLVH